MDGWRLVYRVTESDGVDINGDGRFDYGPTAPGKHLVSVPPSGQGLVTVEVTDPKGHRAFATVRFAAPVTFVAFHLAYGLGSLWGTIKLGWEALLRVISRQAESSSRR